MVDGIKGNYHSSQFQSGNSECSGLKDDDINTIIFIEKEETNTDDNIEITNDKNNSEIEDEKNFDSEEAKVYTEGEEAIQKEVKQRLLQQALMVGINIKGKSEEEIEAEVRAEYAEKHPEYAAVMEEGQAVSKAHAEAKAEAMKEWEEKNPKPEPPNPLTGTTGAMAIYTRKLQEWQAKRAEHEKAFDESYAKENPNYANLKEQQDKGLNLIDILTSPRIKPQVVIKDL